MKFATKKIEFIAFAIFLVAIFFTNKTANAETIIYTPPTFTEHHDDFMLNCNEACANIGATCLNFGTNSLADNNTYYYVDGGCQTGVQPTFNCSNTLIYYKNGIYECSEHVGYQLWTQCKCDKTAKFITDFKETADNLGNTSINTGKFVLNIFWPFLLIFLIISFFIAIVQHKLELNKRKKWKVRDYERDYYKNKLNK